MVNVIHELEKLREFLHGAHLASSDDNAGVVLHQACHKIDELLLMLAREATLTISALP